VTFSWFSELGGNSTAGMGVLGDTVINGSLAVGAAAGSYFGFVVRSLNGNPLYPSGVAIYQNGSVNNCYPLVDHDVPTSDLDGLESLVSGIRCVSLGARATWEGSSLNNAGEIAANFYPALDKRSMDSIADIAASVKAYSGPSKTGTNILWRREDTYEDDVYRPIGDYHLNWQGCIVFAASIDPTVATNGFRVSIAGNWEVATTSSILGPEASPVSPDAYNLAQELMSTMPMATENPLHAEEVKGAIKRALAYFPTLVQWAYYLMPLVQTAASFL